jgi:hypothetical protein
MMTIRSATIFALLMAPGAGLAWSAAVADDSLTAGSVLPAKWAYSVDGGTTWKDKAPKIAGSNSPNAHRHDAAKAEFTVADPAKIGILKIATKDPHGALALTGGKSVDRYDVGSSPNLLETKIVLNGKPTDLGHDPNTLYRYLAIQPSDLKAGVNTLQLAGYFWHKNYGAGAVPCDLQLEVIPMDRAVLDRLPILGMIGDDYFGVACRAVIPSQFTVAVTAVEPAGAAAKYSFGPARLLKVKVPLPKGTRTFRYTVTVAAGGASKSYGPYEARVPQGGVGFRFMAGGGTAIYKGDVTGVMHFLDKVREVHPDVFIHTGNYQNCNPWDFIWTQDFLPMVQPTFASIPMFATVNITEMTSPESFGHTFFFPPDDADRDQWTVAIGNVRFVALEAFGLSDDDTGAGVKWLEDVLKSAKEDYVLVLSAHAADCVRTGVGKLYDQGRKFAAARIDPLLVKYNVTAAIGNMYRGYNRIEPPAGQGVPTILTGRAGGYIGLNFKIALAHKEQSKVDTTDDHYVLFEVKSDCLEMKTVGLDGKLLDARTFKPRK